MTQPALQHGPRGFRPLGWVLGAVLCLAVLAVAALIWFFGFAWPHSGHRAQQSADDQTREVAQTIARQLQDRSADGRLTAAEIADVVTHLPAQLLSTQLDSSPLTVVAKLHGVASGPAGSVGSARCYQFTVAAPVGPASHVDAIPLAACPPTPGPSS